MTGSGIRWLVFCAGSLFLVWYGIHAAGMIVHGPNPYGVFGSFWASGLAITQRHNPYAVWPLTFRFHPFGLDRPPFYDLNLSPPFLLPLFQIFARMAPPTAAYWWTGLSTLTFLGTTAALVFELRHTIQKRQIAWMLIAPAVLDTLLLGQDYALLFLFATLAFLCLRHGKSLGAALCIGVLIAIKPNLLPWLLMLWLTGSRRLAYTAAAVFAALYALPISLYGPGIYVQWLEVARHDPHSIFPTDSTIIGFMTRLGVRPVGVVLATALLLAILVFGARRRMSALDASSIAVTASLLCSPLAWFNYVLLLVPAFVAKPWGRWSNLAAALFFVPVEVPRATLLWPRWGTALGGAIYLVPLCILLLHFLRSRTAPEGAATSGPGSLPEPLAGAVITGAPSA